MINRLKCALHFLLASRKRKRDCDATAVHSPGDGWLCPPEWKRNLNN